MRVDRLVSFHREFGATARSLVGAADSEKIRFIKEALTKRGQLQIDLDLELTRFSQSIGGESPETKAAYFRKIKLAIERVKRLQAEGGKAVKLLALEKYEPELNEYARELDKKAKNGG